MSWLPWLDVDDVVLIERAGKGVANKLIARELDRSVHAVQSRLWKLRCAGKAPRAPIGRRRLHQPAVSSAPTF